jgi:antitoxin PrlF
MALSGEAEGAKLDFCKKVRHLTRMNIVFSKITSKSQTVIPREIRELLGLKPGDSVRYAVTSSGVQIAKADKSAQDDPFAVFGEWSSDADEKAYGDL